MKHALCVAGALFVAAIPAAAQSGFWGLDFARAIVASPRVQYSCLLEGYINPSRLPRVEP